MPKQNAPLLAFNRGIVSPLALGRVDIARLAFSAEVMTNWMPRTLGSMMLRPGFEYLVDAGTTRPRYLPFVFAVDDAALIEFTDGNVRVIVDDAALAFVAVSDAIANGDFSSAMTGWTDADDSGATSSSSTGPGTSVVIATREVYDHSTSGTPTASYKLDNDGITYTKRTVQDGGVFQAVSGEWMLSGIASDYECRATLTSGTFSTGTAGSWLNLGTDRTWTVAQSTDGSKKAVFTLEIRAAGSTTTIAQATITLRATRDSATGGGAGIGGDASGGSGTLLP